MANVNYVIYDADEVILHVVNCLYTPVDPTCMINWGVLLILLMYSFGQGLREGVLRIKLCRKFCDDHAHALSNCC